MEGIDPVDAVIDRIETELENRPDKKMSYADLKETFKDVNNIIYFSAISRLRRDKRIERKTEDGVVYYKLI
jgi:hypothetical protein